MFITDNTKDIVLDIGVHNEMGILYGYCEPILMKNENVKWSNESMIFDKSLHVG